MKARLSYYAMGDLVDISLARTLRELVIVALRVLNRMPRPICWVAGPITSGRTGQEENRKRLRDTILRLKVQGKATFNYLPLQKRAMRILRGNGGVALSAAEESRFQERLRDELYAPIFQSGRIDELYLVPRFTGSLNARWMRKFALTHRGMKIKYVPEGFVSK
jgi:hypothetical protein